MDNHQKLHAIGRQLQQRWLFLRRRGLAGEIFLVASGLAFLATVGARVFGWPISLFWLYGGILGLALLVWAGLAWWVRVEPLSVLIAADRTMGLEERLSTAYEYEQQQPDHRFVPGLVAEAEQAAARVDARLVFPSHLPRRLWGIPLLLLAIIGLHRFDMTPFHFDDLAQDEASKEVQREGKRLEDWGRKLEQLAQQEQLDRSLILARHMKHLGRRLQREGDKGEQASERISTLSQYLQRLHQELRERALMSESGAMAVQDILASGKSVKQELQDILQLLRGDTLPGEMKNVAEQGIQRLSRQLGDNPELQQLMQDLQAGNVSAARQLLQDLIQKQQAAEDMEHLDRARRALQYSARSLQNDKPSESSTKPQPSQGQQPGESGEAFDFGDETLSEDMPGMDDFDTPGFGEDHGFGRHAKQGPKRDLRESEQPVTKVPVKSGEGQMRLGYMRHLPLHNEAKVPLEQAVVTYQQAAEQVLAQEQIPRGYRDQIKQYFLAIGMAASETQAAGQEGAREE